MPAPTPRSAVCAVHAQQATFTCRRCGAFGCQQCRQPTDAMAQLFRTTAAALQDDGTAVTWLCEKCLFKAGQPRSVALPLVGFGLLLLALIAGAAWLSRL